MHLQVLRPAERMVTTRSDDRAANPTLLSQELRGCGHLALAARPSDIQARLRLRTEHRVKMLPPVRGPAHRMLFACADADIARRTCLPEEHGLRFQVAHSILPHDLSCLPAQKTKLRRL